MSRFLRLSWPPLPPSPSPPAVSPQNCATFPLLLLAHILCRRRRRRHACGHCSPSLSLSVPFLMLCTLCGYSPFHFILHILLWQPLAPWHQHQQQQPHTFFIIMSAYQHVANILHGHRRCRRSCSVSLPAGHSLAKR